MFIKTSNALKIKLLTVFLLFLPFGIFSKEICQPWQPSDAEMKPFIISAINLDVNNIFDLNNPKESRKFHHLANAWHVTTKERIIKRELLFQVGNELDLRLLAETERLLRKKPYIKEATIVPTSVCGNKVTVLVKTKDNWTLTPGISYGRTAGINRYAFELQEKNLFGLGKSLEFKYKKGLDRIQKSIKYNDDNLFGTRNRLDVIYEDNSDGKLNFLNYYRPFFSLDSPVTWELRYYDNQRITPLYDFGIITGEIGQNRLTYTLNYGKLSKRTSDSVHRYLVGFTSDESDFFSSETYPNSQLPNSRSYQYPWISYEFFTEDFVKRTNFNRMGRIEDISLGHHLFTKIGRSFSDSSLHFSFTYSKGLSRTQSDLILLDSSVTGIYDKQLLNTSMNVQLKWFHTQSDNRTFYSRILLNKNKNLFLENRQYLGGDTGLRGYPLRYLNGDNRLLLTLEQRFFYNWYPLKTFKFASAVFVDSGAAWNNNEEIKQTTNIGIGLRLVPTRTSSGQIIHIDLAVPLNNRDTIDSWQLQLRAKHSF